MVKLKKITISKAPNLNLKMRVAIKVINQIQTHFGIWDSPWKQLYFLITSPMKHLENVWGISFVSC